MNKQQLEKSATRILVVSRVAAFLVLGAAISTNVALAGDGSESEASSAVSSVVSSPPPPKFAPMTRGERFGNYLIRIVGPQAFITTAVAAGISQAENTPKEWGGGNDYAQQFIRGTLEYGVSAALHEDNRYFVSGQTGFFRRTKYAVVSTMLSRHDNGDQSFSFSRIGSAAGATFISGAMTASQHR